MTVLAATPVLVPLLTAAATALCSGKAKLQTTISFAGVLVFLVCALALTTQAAGGGGELVAFGGWEAPFGIQFQLDGMGSVLVLITALMGTASLLFLTSEADPGPRQPMMIPLIHGTLAGVAGAFSTADLFNMYVWFEIMLICALGLMAIGGRLDQLDATFKYLGLNMFGTLLLLIAVGMVYAITGHLNYGALAQASQTLSPQITVLVLGTLGIALLLKSAAFPLNMWLPASYHSMPAPVLALLAGLLTKVGVYAILRMLGDVFDPAPQVLFEVLGWVAVATMITGVLGAAYHWDMRRILAFHIISQIGYILLGIALGGKDGNAAALFYTVHHIVVKANLFLIAGMAFAMTGSYDLRKIGGLYAAKPLLGVLIAIPMLSLVGIPPLSGFWAKVLVLEVAIEQGRILWTIAALLVSVLTLYSMMKIWMEAFWKPHPDPNWTPNDKGLAPAWAATILLAAVTLFIGLNPEVLASYAKAAAATLGQ